MRMTKMIMIIAEAAGMMIVTAVAPVAVVLGGVLLSFSSSRYQPAMAQQEITDTDATTTTGLNTSITTANTTTQSQTSESKDVNMLYSRGYEAYEQGMYQQAIEYFDRVLAIDPNFLEALHYKGSALNSLQRHQEAIEYYDRALAIDPNYVNVLISKGNVLVGLQRYEEAIEHYDRALAIAPNSVVALNNKGATLHDLGRYQEAIEYFDRVLAIDPNDSDALTNRALALDSLGGGGNITTTTNSSTSGSAGNATDIVTIVSHRPLKEPMTFPPVQEDFGIAGIIGEVRNDSPNTIGKVDVRGNSTTSMSSSFILPMVVMQNSPCCNLERGNLSLSR